MGNRTRILFILLGFAAPLGWGAEQSITIPSGGLPNLTQATLQIPWSEFKSVMNAAQEATEARRKLLEEKEPPAPWSIGEARYDIATAGEASLKVDVSMAFQKWSQGWNSIPVLGDCVAPISAAVDGKPVVLTSQGEGWLSILVHEPGPHTFSSSFFVACVTHDGDTSFSFPCASSAITRAALLLPLKDALLTAPAASNIAVTQDKDNLRAALAFRRCDTIEVHWTEPAKLPQASPPVEPRVAASAWTLSNVSDSYVTCETHVRYRVLRGQVSAFGIEIPSRAHVLNVSGDGIAWSQSEQDGKHVIDVKTNHVITDTCAVTLSYDAGFTGELADAPLARTTGVVQDDGFVVVAARGAIEISPGAAIEGLTRVDTSELPNEAVSSSTTPVLLAFRHGGGERLLALSVRKLNDVSVPDSSIDQSQLTTLITEEGMSVTRASYVMRNSLRQFLRLRVDPKAEIWSTLVGGRPVKPARDDANSDVLVPLAKSADVDRRLSAFPVEIVYAERFEPVRGWRGDYALKAPAADILSSATTWTVLTPRSRWVYSTSGDLKLAEGEDVLLRDILPARVRRPASGSRRETVYRLRESIERFLITDINNASASGAGGTPQRYAGEPIPASGASATASVAGVLPVSVSLPATGVAHTFSRVLVSQGTELSLALHTRPHWLYLTLRCLSFVLLVVAGFSGGLIGMKALGKLSHGGTLAYVMAAGLGACVIVGVLVVQTLQLSAAPVWGSAVAGVVVVVAPWFRDALFARRVRRQRSGLAENRKEAVS